MFDTPPVEWQAQGWHPMSENPKYPGRHWSQRAPPTPGLQGQDPLIGLQLLEREPVRLQAQGEQPRGLRAFKLVVPLRHWSHFSPMTLPLHRHRPVCEPHVKDASNVPAVLQPQGSQPLGLSEERPKNPSLQVSHVRPMTLSLQ